MIQPGVIERYRRYLPVTDSTPVVSLGEGSTPLLLSRYLSEKTGADIYLKLEGLNPTGSFKDRGMTLAVSKALEEGSKTVICASTGNTSASAAAYAARAGLACAVLIPKGKVARGKLAQALIHGAKVVEVDGSFDEALKITQGLERSYPVTLVNSVNPFRIEGQKTGAFEVYEQLGRYPEYHLMPVGNAGNITAYWKGYTELSDGSSSLPRMFGFQAAGAAPIVLGHPVPEPETIATAIRIGNPASWQQALDASTQSHGGIEAVTDDQIVDAYKMLAAEGVFVEAASAAAVAGLLQLSARGVLEKGATAVCILTGHGLKDPDLASQVSSAPTRCEADIDEIAAALEL